MSAIPDDPRVRRQGDELARHGWDVIAIGIGGHRSPLPDWKLLDIGTDDIQQRVRALTRTERMQRRLGRLFDLATLRVSPKSARRVFWRLNSTFGKMLELAATQKVDFWLANDWTTLPIAETLAMQQGVPFGYDTHELAVDEYAHRWTWRQTMRPIIRGVEQSGFRRAAFATCVSDGIADRLNSLYRPDRKPTVIRNAPVYQFRELRPTTTPIRVLYHGIVAPGRGLEASIRSVAFWRPEFTLTIRGGASSEFRDLLQGIAVEAGVSDRIDLVPPVPMIELVKSAAEFDVGLFALPDHSLQNTYVLPNKFFEYVMAGLALCVSDLPEMRRLSDEYKLGPTFRGMEPTSIAAAINSLNPASIDACKARALAAAKVLNWEHEGAKLVKLCEAACGAGRATVSMVS